MKWPQVRVLDHPKAGFQTFLTCDDDNDDDLDKGGVAVIGALKILALPGSGSDGYPLPYLTRTFFLLPVLYPE